ncbi:VF530 family protein [uncultured Paraglaciecola sp.]|uniref:VF530 family protein n=1 Tax=uncultured Paraglaciecola sp. TaxID=1765024 RepID=UPI0030D7DE56|tara:strand:- start:50801 stop:51100 length:300 start_codon:yes stop_codon:yes gene_type:complete
MTKQQNNPLHGLTLQTILETLVKQLGFEEMGQQVKINCFTSDPSIKSSLKFLRKTPWAREKVEQLYLSTVHNSSKEKSKQPTEKFVWPDLTKDNPKKDA